MDLGNTIIQLRKAKDISMDDLAITVGTSGAIIERYERGEISPSVEVAAKIAKALEVSLDYLVGNTSVLVKDKKILYRLELLDKIADSDRDTILRVVDSFLKDAQHHSTSKKLKA